MSTPRALRYRLDGSYRRPLGGRVLIGGSPLRLLTVAPRAVGVLEQLERDGTVADPSSAERALLERLVDLGALHPVPSDAAVADAVARGASEVTVVTPCLRSGVAGSSTPSSAPARVWRCAAVVVDDGSVPPLPSPPPGTTLIRLERNVGPGGARNAGLATVTTPFVAFVDDDVAIDEDELLGLLAWFDDPRVALVAPRVRAAGGHGALARFELARSPLDLGAEPARVDATTRVSYVPAAVVLCRTEALRSIGGFDADLRWGEDVDLVWRLRAAGWRCRYDPSVVARHRTRSSLRSWCAQRFRYGTSAAPLAERHPGALAPVRMSGWSAAAWAPVLAGFPLVGLVVGAGTTAALVRKLRTVPAAESVRLAGLGNLYAGRLLASTLTRSWWPVAVAAALVSRRARRMVALAVIVPIVLDHRHDRPEVDPLTYAALHVLDDAAYGSGVWAGAWRRRSFAPLLPSFESWPPRRP